MATTNRRRRRYTVTNATGGPVVFNEAGAYIFTPGDSREADPEDHVTRAQVAAGRLIEKEG